MALRIYTNNLHHAEHIFREKFQKEASTREMEILVQTVSYKNIFGRNKMVAVLLMMQLNPHEQLINGKLG